MALEVVRLRVLQTRASAQGFVTINHPEDFVNSQVILGHEDRANPKDLIGWLNQIIMVFPSEFTRGELFASALTRVYGSDWTVLAANPMAMAMKHGRSLEWLRDDKMLQQFGISHQDY
jgi:hypothetical protein